ncbi:hypothetical protein D9M68_746270 [compost metagenome]
MRADQDIYLTFFQPLQCVFFLLGRFETVQVIYGTREFFQAIFKRLKVLVGKDRSRNQYGHLLAIRYCLECRTNSYFCFSETYITTNQAVHRIRRFHIALYICRSFGLIWCIFIEE